MPLTTLCEKADGLTRSDEFVRMKLVGANRFARMNGLDELPGKSNFFVGNDPQLWRNNVANYSKVKCEDVYPGLDLVYYGKQNLLEYDLIVAPGADLRSFALKFEDARMVQIDSSGDLVLRFNFGEIRQSSSRRAREGDPRCEHDLF